jgi:LacI family kdg operon repressor
MLEELLKTSKEKTVIFALKERWITEFVPSLFYNGYIDNKNVAVTGFADTKLAKYIDPQTKLIAQDPYLLGASSGEVMTDILLNLDVKLENKIVVPAKFG